MKIDLPIEMLNCVIWALDAHAQALVITKQTILLQVQPQPDPDIQQDPPATTADRLGEKD